MDEELEKMAPTACIETVVVVRPLKVLSLLLAILNLILLVLTIGASAWVQTEYAQEGLWTVCIATTPGKVECDESFERSWLLACRAMCIIASVLNVTAIVICCIGLNADNIKRRYRSYFVSMLVYFLAALFNVTALIIYPVKYSEEMESRQLTWSLGYTYWVGWGSSCLLLLSALLICVDKDADELVYRERTSYNNEGIEEVSS